MGEHVLQSPLWFFEKRKNMQFIANGPDIPDELLQAHEEGRVVFFCGAGISCTAGLPGFQGLVDVIYESVGTTKEAIEQDAFDRKQFDVALELLERRLPGQRLAVRSALAQALQPQLDKVGATDTHAALLQLARSRDNVMRLVTTNFDRIFEEVAKRQNQPHQAYPAPFLPIPKASRWNGLVYLHGLLPENKDSTGLNQLVITSGDFGLAYLTERWAARFVSELFRNYVVCFVGYSIDDPVIRYMMDALAADRILGEITPQAYALRSCTPGFEGHETRRWIAKGVTPILYEVPADSHDHSALHLTLKKWSETYRDGSFGKEQIVASYARTHPASSTQQDDFVGRMLWALSDNSGLPAKRFAEFDPVPSLAWLDALTEERYGSSDLAHFGIMAGPEVNGKVCFSLLNRPVSGAYAPRMLLVSGGEGYSPWDPVMNHLACWLTRHLNDPKLVVWLSQYGGQLHPNFCRLIENKLNALARSEKDGSVSDFEKIRANAPNAVPGKLMRNLWGLILARRVKSGHNNLNSLSLHNWKEHLRRDGLTTALRLELRDLLSPKVDLKNSTRWGYNSLEEEPEHLSQLVGWELVLTSNNAAHLLDYQKNEHFHRALPFLINDFQQLLMDALDLCRELGAADEKTDQSYWDLPSISQHWQNRGFHDWVALIEMLRDAWLIVNVDDSARATRIAEGWFELPYPTFKRLALFAASQDDCINPEKWLKWLSTNNTWWLWAPETKRETMRLLVLQGENLSAQAGSEIEELILAGPPRAMFRADIESEDWQSLADYSTWLRLAKLQAGGHTLGNAAHQRFRELSQANSQWELASNESDEFSHWMSGTGDPDYEANREIDIAPRKRKEIVDWLKQPQKEHHMFYESTWRETCRTRFFHVLGALYDLSNDDLWPVDYWREALHVWSEKDESLRRSWKFAAPLVKRMSNETIHELDSAITWWLESASKSIECHEDILIDICQLVLALPYQLDEEIKDPISRAINHPIGHVTQTLLNFWFKRDEPKDNDFLPEDILIIFTQICNLELSKFRHGRVILASRLIALFRVDKNWTEENLLPIFVWGNNLSEAKAAWQGFLWSARLHQPLLIAFKEQLLETVKHYNELGRYKRRFTTFLTYVVLESVEGYNIQDFQQIINTLPKDTLQDIARTLLQALESSGDQRENYWENRIQPFLRDIWPKSRELISKEIADSFALMIIAAGNKFPEGVLLLKDWLQPLGHSFYIIQKLEEAALSERFPEDTLTFLDQLVGDPFRVIPNLHEAKHNTEIARSII